MSMFNEYSRSQLIEQLEMFQKMSDKDIEAYNEKHKHSVADRKRELSEALSKQLNIENNEDLVENGRKTCQAMSIVYNPTKEYGKGSGHTNNNTDEYRIISSALVKGIIKNSYEVGKVQNNYYKKKGAKKTSRMSDQEILIEALKILVTQVVGLTPEQYYSIYSTTINRAIHAFDFTKKILDVVDEKTKEEYNYDNKNIIFGLCFPEFYEQQKKSNESISNIIYCSGSQKSGYIKNSKVNKIYNKSTDSDMDFIGAIESLGDNSSGKIVDAKIFNALNEMFEDNFGPIDIEGKKMLMGMLAEYKTYFTDQNTSSPGFVEVIKARGIYETPLDFYYAQLTNDEKLELFDTFVELKATAVESNKGLALIANFIRENRDEIAETMGLEEFE